MLRDEVIDKPLSLRPARLVSTPRPRARWPWIVAAVIAGLLLWWTVLFVEIQRQSGRDEARSADTIIVFGAAEYSGRPSPVWRARLDHAYDLFQRGLAPLVITTGGAGEDPHFTEGGVGRAYLMTRGVPEQHLIAETQAHDTDESVERVATILRTNGFHTCLAVSDDYHIFRIKKMLERHGFAAYGSPRPPSHPVSRWQRFELTSREVISYTLWKMHIT
ncbi:MAG: YdcF family protein [Acidobacteria bacterium]|nr:YdcF family protein [Acidobacteriota bacterium]